MITRIEEFLLLEYRVIETQMLADEERYHFDLI